VNTLNKLFDEPLNEIVNQGFNSFISSMYTINSLYMSTDSTVELINETKSHYFTILCVNILSLVNSKNFNNFSVLLNSLSVTPTYMGITETWLYKNQQGHHQNLSKYKFYSKNKSNTKGGGVGAYVHENQTHLLRDNFSKFEDRIFESLFIELKSNNLNIICETIFRPPKPITKYRPRNNQISSDD